MQVSKIRGQGQISTPFKISIPLLNLQFSVFNRQPFRTFVAINAGKDARSPFRFLYKKSEAVLLVLQSLVLSYPFSVIRLQSSIFSYPSSALNLQFPLSPFITCASESTIATIVQSVGVASRLNGNDASLPLHQNTNSPTPQPAASSAIKG